MYFLLMFIPYVILFGTAMMCQYFAKKSPNQKFLGAKNYYGGMFIAVVFSVFLFCIVLISNLLGFSEQKNNFITLQRQSEEMNIYQKKMVNMTAQFKDVLIKAYPSYEKEIFGKMSPEDLQVLFVKYPELKASLTSMSYTDKISELNNDIYNKEIEMRKTVAGIRWNYVTPWLINSLMPKLPDNLIHDYYYVFK